MALQQRNFNRVCTGTIGALGVIGFIPEGVNMVVSIEQQAPKYLNSIHISVAPIAATLLAEDYLIRVGVFSQQGKFPLTANPSLYSPYGGAPSDLVGDVGTVYYDHVLKVQYNNIITFDTPIYFNSGEQIYVVCSSAYIAGETDNTVAARLIRMSVNGYIEKTPSTNYKFR